MSLNVLIFKTSVGYWGELSVANHYLTSGDGMFVCSQEILLNRVSEFLRRMGKYLAFPRPQSCDCIVIDLILFTHGLAIIFMCVHFLSLLVYNLSQNKMLNATNYMYETFLLRYGFHWVLAH